MRFPFKIGSERRNQLRKDHLQPFGGDHRLHQRPARHETGWRAQRVERLIANPHRLIKPDQHILGHMLTAKPPRQGTARDGKKRPNGLEPKPAQGSGRAGIKAQRFDGKRFEPVTGITRQRPGGADGCGNTGAGRKSIARKALAHVRQHLLLAAKKMGNTGDIQQNAVGGFWRDPRAVALQPAAQAQKAGQIRLRLMQFGQKIRHGGARIRQPLPHPQPEIPRHGVGRDQAQAPGPSLNQRERQAFGRRRFPRFHPSTDEPLDRKFREPD